MLRLNSWGELGRIAPEAFSLRPWAKRWNFMNLRFCDLKSNYVFSNAPLFNFQTLSWNLTPRNVNRKGWERCLQGPGVSETHLSDKHPFSHALGSLALLTFYTNVSASNVELISFGLLVFCCCYLFFYVPKRRKEKEKLCNVDIYFLISFLHLIIFF